MRVAIVGAGIAGLVAADRLHGEHEITLFEAAAHAGGHTLTSEIEIGGRTHAVDAGFVVYNEHTYPNFVLRRGSHPTQLLLAKPEALIGSPPHSPDPRRPRAGAADWP